MLFVPSSLTNVSIDASVYEFMNFLKSSRCTDRNSIFTPIDNLLSVNQDATFTFSLLEARLALCEFDTHARLVIFAICFNNTTVELHFFGIFIIIF